MKQGTLSQNQSPIAKKIHKTIKTFSVLVLLLTTSFITTYSQTAKDVFGNSETPILYLGIDFSKAKIIGEKANEFDIRNKYYPGINEVIIQEPKKYSLKSAFHKSYIDHDLAAVSTRNSKVNAEDILSNDAGDFHKFQVSDIESIVKGYDFGDKKGVGLIFIAEAYSKHEKSTAFWVTLVEMRSHKVLMTERMQGKAGGFGLRNTIASSIEKILDQIEKYKYAEWKAKYAM